MRDLSTLQRLIYQLITAPDGVGEGLKSEPTPPPGGLEAVIRGDQRLSAVQRLDIYANGYFYRLLDVMKEEYPAILTVLGADNFHNLVTGYLIEHRPTQPSLFYAGRFLADFLEGHPARQQWPFIVELARLERAILEVFHAPDNEPLDAAAMRAISPADWPSVILRSSSALDIVDCEWRVNAVLRAIEEQREWSAPEHAPASILIWRQNFQVHYRELKLAERDALLAAHGGASLARICEAVASACGEGNAVEIIGGFLARWLADGVLAQG